MLDDSCVKVLEFFLLLVAFEVGIFYDDASASLHIAFFVRQGDAGLFRDRAVSRGSCYIWIDHDSFVYDDIFSFLFASLGGSNHPDILTDLWCGESDSFVSIHQFDEVVGEEHKFIIDFFHFLRNSPQDRVVGSGLDDIFFSGHERI